MPIKNWSTTPASNNASAPFGAPEGWSPSSVNDWARQTMADIKTQFIEGEWVDRGDSGLSRASATSFKLTGDVTDEYLVGRRVKLYDASTLYGTVATSSYSAPDTTITVSMDSGSLTTSLTSVALSILRPTNTAIPAFSNLATTGTSSLSGAVVLSTTLNVQGATTLSGNAVMKGTMLVEGATTLSGAATIKGITTHESAVVLKTTLNVEGATTLSGNAVLKGTLNVEGATTLSGAATLKGTTTIESATTLKTTLNVEGATTLSGAVVCKSTLTVNGNPVTGGGDWVKISSASASSSSTIDFTGLSSTYAAYAIVLQQVKASTAASLLIRTSTDNGSTFAASTNDYWYVRQVINSSTTESIAGAGESGGATSIIAGALSNGGGGAARLCAGIIYIYNPSGTDRCYINGSLVYVDAVPALAISDFGGLRDTAADVDAVRLLLSTGNFTSGTFTLYGIKA